MSVGEQSEFLKAARQAGLPVKLAYTIPEVSFVSGVPKSTVYEEVAAGRLKTNLVKGRVRGHRSKPEWVDEWLEGSMDGGNAS